ncbi:MAG: hypothetical protein DHS20C16_14490 [Phycisphaerae bacterium]|nr:MAG: hypothetical protein DHS20C16_14490 [Phycisphaerae bacterium]
MFAKMLPFGLTACLVGMTTSEVTAQVPMGTAFTYQGQLQDDGRPADGDADIKFKLFDSVTGGGQIGATLTFDGQTGNSAEISIENGLFAVELDFGASVFQGDACWLEVEIRYPHDPGDTLAYTLLTPRHKLTPSPYAVYAKEAGEVPDGTTGAGTVNYIPKRSGSLAFDDSIIYEAANRIGIGDSNPGMALSVVGGVRSAFDSAEHDYAEMRHTGSDAYLQWAGAGQLEIQYEGDSLAILEQEGSFGLGTLDPSALLHLHRPDAAPDKALFRLTNSVSGTTLYDGIELGFWSENTRDAFLTNWESGWLSFGTGGGVERMRIVSDGDVGIGTSEPSARLDVEGGSIAQLDSGPSNAFGKMSVHAQEGTLDGSGDFSVSIPRSLYQPWTNDNYVFKVEVFVSLDFDSGFPHADKGAAYSMALIHKRRGAGLVNFTELRSQAYDAAVTFAYSSPVVDTLQIDVDTNRGSGKSYRATVKISH